jgi:uncharacterized protein (TIGR03435 family)
MNSKNTPEELLRQSLRLFDQPSLEAMESAGDRVRVHLRSEGGKSPRQCEVAAAPAPTLRRPLRFFAAAVTVGVVAVVLGWTFRAKVEVEDGVSRVSMKQIESHEAFRSGDRTGTTLVLPDDSRVEMRAGTQLSFDRVGDGLRILLKDGSILVSAAKQRTGHLYVQTKDVTVSVVGTVFLVKAEQQGSRVAVIEGEVRVQSTDSRVEVTQGEALVQQDSTEKRLRPGDQLATNPSMELQPVSKEIAWSPHAESHLALLQQSNPTVPATRESVEKPLEKASDNFEVISIRPSAPVQGSRGTAASGDGPCGPSPKIDPSRFAALNTTVYDLVSRAYRLGSCSSVDQLGLLTVGPEWIKSDRFDIEAVIPVGAVSGTLTLANPKLQAMLQNLLSERFKLVLRREMKDKAVYLVTVAKGGPKLTPTKEGDERGFKISLAPPNSKGETSWHFESKGYALAGFFRQLPDIDRPVVDRTGVTGLFNFNLEFAPRRDGYYFQPDKPTPVSSSARALFTVIEEDLGLKVESTRAPVEVMVIDRAERPRGN